MVENFQFYGVFIFLDKFKVALLPLPASEVMLVNGDYCVWKFCSMSAHWHGVFPMTWIFSDLQSSDRTYEITPSDMILQSLQSIWWLRKYLFYAFMLSWYLYFYDSNQSTHFSQFVYFIVLPIKGGFQRWCRNSLDNLESTEKGQTARRLLIQVFLSHSFKMFQWSNPD